LSINFFLKKQGEHSSNHNEIKLPATSSALSHSFGTTSQDPAAAAAAAALLCAEFIRPAQRLRHLRPLFRRCPIWRQLASASSGPSLIPKPYFLSRLVSKDAYAAPLRLIDF
jgi:hypothetical protein